MLPSVYIRSEALVQMMCASVEPFKKECLGVLFGRMPTKNDNQFIITYVLPLQYVKRIGFSEIATQQKSWRRLENLFFDMPPRFRPIGDFHSHAKWGEQLVSDEMSEQDEKDMRKQENALEIIVSISSRNNRPQLWVTKDNGSLAGSFGSKKRVYDFVISAYMLEPNYTQKPKPKKIKIIAPEFIKAFNYALEHR